MGALGRLAVFILLIGLIAPSQGDARTHSLLRTARSYCSSAYQKMAAALGLRSEEGAGAVVGGIQAAARPVLREHGVVNIGGEEFLKFDRDGPNWKLQVDADYFRGNPQWNLDLAGRKTMEDLGFRYEDQAFFAPVAETYNARIEKLNLTLPPDQKIILRYYTPSADNVSNEDYVRALARFEHPAARGDRGALNEAPHDANFHAPLLPKEWYEQMARKAQALVGFSDWLKATKPDLLENGMIEARSIKSFLDGRFESLAGDLDLVSAVALAHPKYPEQHFPINALWGQGHAGMVQAMLFDGRTSMDVLSELGWRSGFNVEFDEAVKDYLKTVQDLPDYKLSIKKTPAQVKRELGDRLKLFRARK